MDKGGSEEAFLSSEPPCTLNKPLRSRLRIHISVDEISGGREVEFSVRKFSFELAAHLIFAK